MAWGSTLILVIFCLAGWLFTLLIYGFTVPLRTRAPDSGYARTATFLEFASSLSLGLIVSLNLFIGIILWTR